MKNRKIEHVWSVICSGSVLDSETQNLSLNNLIEKLTLSISANEWAKIKAVKSNGVIFPFDFEIVSRLLRRKLGPANILLTYRVRMLNPVGETMLFSNPQEISFGQGISNTRIRTRFNQIPVQDAGMYSLAIEVKEENDKDFQTVYEIPLEIVLNIENK